MEQDNGLTVNDGNGMFDKYGMIDSCIKTLRNVKVRVEDLSTTGVEIVDVINRLDTLKDGMQEEDKRNEENKKIQEVAQYGGTGKGI